MTRRILAIAAVAVLAAVALAITQPWLYFVNREVNEAFPDLTQSQRNSISQMPDDEKQALLDMAKDNTDMAEQSAIAMIQPASVVPDSEQAMPKDMPASPRVRAAGEFNHIDPIHGADGFAKIYELPDERWFLRFEEFHSKNGPDLHVYLSRDYPDSTFAGLGEDPLHLGALKGNIGSQNYALPDDFTLTDYRSVVIYCLPFRVVFSSAQLVFG